MDNIDNNRSLIAIDSMSNHTYQILNSNRQLRDWVPINTRPANTAFSSVILYPRPQVSMLLGGGRLSSNAPTLCAATAAIYRNQSRSSHFNTWSSIYLCPIPKHGNSSRIYFMWWTHNIFWCRIFYYSMPAGLCDEWRWLGWQHRSTMVRVCESMGPYSNKLSRSTIWPQLA